MTQIIGIKDLQTKTKQIRQQVEKGEHFIVVCRSKPIFELKPLEKSFEKNPIFFLRKSRKILKSLF